MKPLPGDYRHKLLISGDELEELKPPQQNLWVSSGSGSCPSR